jgi:hypothetical protein
MEDLFVELQVKREKEFVRLLQMNGGATQRNQKVPKNLLVENSQSRILMKQKKSLDSTMWMLYQK